MSPQNVKDRVAWLQGTSARCEDVAANGLIPWRLVLLGAPGVGKGTQADLLNQRLGACHLSTGDVFRAAGSRSECEQSPAMKEALGYMRRGALVPDSTVWEMVRERAGWLRCGGGFILDGFPPTLGQAESLQQLLDSEKLALTAVVNYELPTSEIVARLGGRRTCEECKGVFHLTERPPKVELLRFSLTRTKLPRNFSPVRQNLISPRSNWPSASRLPGVPGTPYLIPAL